MVTPVTAPNAGDKWEWAKNAEEKDHWVDIGEWREKLLKSKKHILVCCIIRLENKKKPRMKFDDVHYEWDFYAPNKA